MKKNIDNTYYNSVYLSIILFSFTLISYSANAKNSSDNADNVALYGDLDVLETYKIPELRSGHDALRPLSKKLSPYFDFKKQLGQNYGLNFVIEYSPQLQWELSSSKTHHANDETNIILQWSPVDHSNPKKGNLTGWYQISRTLGTNHTSNFMDELGVITPTNGGDTAPDDYRDLMQMLAWEQWFANEKLRINVGKLTTRTFLNLNRYASGDREDFLTPMLVNNPVSPFTARNGLGMFAQYFWNTFYLTGMLREADGTSEGISFDTLNSGKWESALELGLTPNNFIGLGKGYYRFTAYYTDSIGSDNSYQPSGWSAALSFDQDIGENYGVFWRYAYADKNVRDFKQRLAVGMQIKNPLNFKHDRIGIASWWGDPSATEMNSEYGLEAFWKFQLSPFLEITPDVQIILNSQGNSRKSTVFIGGLRMRLVF